MTGRDTRLLVSELLDSLDGDHEIVELVVGAFAVGCVSHHLGLASHARPPMPEHAVRPVQAAGQLLPSSAHQLAARLFDGSALEASIAVAALNSLLKPPLERCIERNAALLLAERSEGRHIAVVGHFPFVDRLRGIARQVDVFELKEGKQDGDLDAELMPERLSRADVVAITGTALTNGTLGAILSLARRDAFIALVGASAPLSPVLFDHGIDAVCGAYAPRAELPMACISQGATFRQIEGIQRLILMKT